MTGTQVVIRRWLRGGRPRKDDPGVELQAVVVKRNGTKVCVRLADGALLWVRRCKVFTQ